VMTTHDPGGKVRLKLHPHIASSADFSDDGQYRYSLRRTWDDSLPSCMFVGMNPSTADLTHDDPTLAKCRRFAVKWGYGTLLMANVFAYRATNQRRLLEVRDPIGPHNDDAILALAHDAHLVIMAYGKPHVRLRQRGPLVAKLIRQHAGKSPHILRLSKDGVPSHPLYLPETLLPVPWQF
jgi:hypothetical protein